VFFIHNRFEESLFDKPLKHRKNSRRHIDTIFNFTLDNVDFVMLMPVDVVEFMTVDFNNFLVRCEELLGK
jgi:hypothetical protein